jgi:glutamine cyclotransferase
MIDLRSGEIVREWVFKELSNNQRMYILKETKERSYDFGNNVLNGIAYEPDTDTFILTGKDWDFAYRVKLDY